MFLKSIDMFLKCSWIVLEFSLQKLLANLEKITKIWISQEQKELLQLNKKTFFIILKDYHLVKKRKTRQKIVDVSFNNLCKKLISMIRQKQWTKSNRHFSKKNSLHQILPNLCNFLSHDPIYWYLWNVK